MKIIHTQERAARRGAAGNARARGTLALAVAAAAVLVVACSTSDLLTVQVPNSVNANIFDNPAYAVLMVNSVIGDYECAFGGFVTAEGIATDELQDASLTAANWQLDRRDDGFTSGSYGTVGCTSTEGLYTPLSTARWEADQAINRLSGWTVTQVPTITTLTAEANLYAGFSYANLGVSMCQAAFDKGPLVGQLQMFALAEARFTAAVAAAKTVGLTNVLNAAYVGRARVRLFQHNASGAIADAQLVPAGFVFNAGMDATNPRRFSHVYTAISTNGSATVEASTRVLTTENAQVDPRSATTKLTTKPGDGVSLIYIPNKYNAASLTAGEAIPMPIARYEEAQLILAEAQGGAAAVTIINTMRAAVSLLPYIGPTDAASITNLIIGERQRVLFVEGFRAFDIERFGLALTPPADSAYREGGVYGHTVCLPIPDLEVQNNPNIVPAQIIDGVQGHVPVP